MAEFKSYRAEPGQKFGFTTTDGAQQTLKADESGRVTARTPEEEQVLAGFGLREARATESEKSEAPKKGG